MQDACSTHIATTLNIRPAQAQAAIRLLDDGASVPFIARYRKEQTGALDDSQLRELANLLSYQRSLAERRAAILASLQAQNQLTPALEQALQQADNKQALEDLYLPYKPKRRTKAQLAREAGFGPLAAALLKKMQQPAQALATEFCRNHQTPPDEALEGARQILIEEWAERAAVRSPLRDWLGRQGELVVKVLKGQQDAGSKFRDYFDYRERLARIPSHRALAILRGQQAGILRYRLEPQAAQADEGIQRIARTLRLHTSNTWLMETARQCWQQKLRPQLETELVRTLREQAEAEAIKVFGRNLKNLLLAAPAGNKVTLGLDPGLRTGVKAVVVDATGKLLEHTTIYPHAPRNQWDQAVATLRQLVERHTIELIAVGNGTASRETEQLAQALNTHAQTVMVSEAGASVYSASELAAREFPQLDVTLRGAVSIARRLQDPLAELVKIEPKAIGVGQYQHDVDQKQLSQALEAVVEDCVNHVGVDLNTASAALLSQVAGLNTTQAANILNYRESHGRFNNRRELLKVPRLGAKAFEQCAGFLRIREGDQPLDNSAVHPEAYPLVQRMAAQLNTSVAALLNNPEPLAKLDLADLEAQGFGRYTLRDVQAELAKPGRDPRPAFKTAQFAEGVETLADLHEGMSLEGCVTNVTNFGAFVDIGVHQDGLVHISQLADHFIRDPHQIVSTGDIVTVRVLEVDTRRKRIALSMRSAG